MRGSVCERTAVRWSNDLRKANPSLFSPLVCDSLGLKQFVIVIFISDSYSTAFCKYLPMQHGGFNCCEHNCTISCARFKLPTYAQGLSQETRHVCNLCHRYKPHCSQTVTPLSPNHCCALLLMQTEYFCFNIKSIKLVKNVLLLSIVEI